MEKGDRQHPLEKAATTEGVPVAPSLEPALENTNFPFHHSVISPRILVIVLLSAVTAVFAGVIAQALTALIGFVTNLAFYGRLSAEFVSPAGNNLGYWVIIVPSIGGIIVGLMARYGAKGIRGHGIPEAMEQVLTNKSRISPKMTFLKPVSAAVAIGTGGPFGAEGPIIATGGALGSLIGQLLKTTADERKVLLAAGAAAGMTATFGTPVSAVLLAIELLLFEFRPRSINPVAIACVTAEAVRIAFVGSIFPVFEMPELQTPSYFALVFYIVLGVILGVVSVFITRAVYFVEDSFERLPIHWMWWPAIGGIAVGVIGYFFPLTLGVGYENIENIVSGALLGKALAVLCVFKFLSWVISLGSGTSGGTLAPLLTVGGALGALLSGLVPMFFPGSGVDTRLGALIGMAAIFAGASRAFLASVLFAFETTLEPLSLFPLLGACGASYLVSSLLMKQSIMTEKIVRRGIHVPMEYNADLLAQRTVKETASYKVVSLSGEDSVEKVRAWIEAGGTSHQGFPVLDPGGNLIGVVTRKDLFDPQVRPGQHVRDIIKRSPVFIHEADTIRKAVDLMAREKVGRLPVLKPAAPGRPLVAILSRSDLLRSYSKAVEDAYQADRTLKWPRVKKKAYK